MSHRFEITTRPERINPEDKLVRAYLNTATNGKALLVRLNGGAPPEVSANRLGAKLWLEARKRKLQGRMRYTKGSKSMYVWAEPRQ